MCHKYFFSLTFGRSIKSVKHNKIAAVKKSAVSSFSLSATYLQFHFCFCITSQRESWAFGHDSKSRRSQTRPQQADYWPKTQDADRIMIFNILIHQSTSAVKLRKPQSCLCVLDSPDFRKTRAEFFQTIFPIIYPKPNHLKQQFMRDGWEACVVCENE